MEITFSDEYAISSQTCSINFEAFVDGQRVVCSVSIEALQDIDQSNVANMSAEQQFTANLSKIHAIAKNKIRAQAVEPVFIKISDLSD